MANNKIIPYGNHYVDKNDIALVAQTLKKKKITTGNEVTNFELKIKKYLKCNYVSVCNSGTSAIFLAMQSIGIKKNDNIIMPSINFISSYNVAKILGANVFLADVDKYTGQMTPRDVENCCKKFALKKVKALIIMYNGGYPQNADKFKFLKKKLRCFIIEDACHALGAIYKSKKIYYKIGSCRHSDISTFSLHPLKTITTGEGGIVTTNNKAIYEKVKKLRTLGIMRSKNKHWEYDVIYPGFNFRLTDFQCSLGSSQLKKIHFFIKSREKIFKRYTNKLKSIAQIKCPNYLRNYKSSYHLYLINIIGFNKIQKENLIKYMLKNKIVLQYHYIPIYKFKIFKDKYIGKKAEIYYNSTISLPIYVGLTTKEQNLIINLLKFFFNK